MGSPRLAALLLPSLLLLISLSASARTGCFYLPRWSTRCLLASHREDLPIFLPVPGWSSSSPQSLGVLCPGPGPSHALCASNWCQIPQAQEPAILSGDALSGDGSTSCCGNSESLTSSCSVGDIRCQHLLRENYYVACVRRTITSTCPTQTSPARGYGLKGPNLWSYRQWKISSPGWTYRGMEEIVSGGHTVDLSYEFLLPCLCIEASYLQEDTVRRKKCPFKSWPEAYGSDFWKSVHITDYSQHNQMVMALKLHCPLKLEASLCQRQGRRPLCEDLPNATARESDGWYVLEKVDLNPQLCFKFSFGNSSHTECPHKTVSSWNVSMDTQAQQLILHFSSRVHATFSAAWSHPDSRQDSFVLPVYSVSQTQGSSPVTLDLIIPFLRPGACVLVWRSDVQFAWKHILCPDVTHRHLGLLILALLVLTTLLGIVLILTQRCLLSGTDQARPVLLLHAADSEAQRRLVGALAELLRTALGGGRDVIVDLWEGTRVARMGPLPWLWAARARVARERGTVLLLWSGSRQAGGPDLRAAPLCALLRTAPRPLLLLAYFNRLCTKGDIPPPLRALPRYRLLRDLPRLLRALDARPSTGATSWDGLGARPCLRGRLALCRQLEREAARPADQG
ncbi:interleukin-17 receptor E isoform X3 [Tamandua tetradactyla]|uniref:interleukin-17 receptor E isoform X3 n=1 Tax=Tamandua tetradactyla TaxID=48850 RepID=UPI0040546E25